MKIKRLAVVAALALGGVVAGTTAASAIESPPIDARCVKVKGGAVWVSTSPIGAGIDPTSVTIYSVGDCI